MSTPILPIDVLAVPTAALASASFPRPFPPPWCCAWGDDRYGLWANFEVLLGEQAIVQRMRWIEPGVFVMGSPPEEEGRYDDEGPQHQVTISAGFWLADTACTQALWQAVMGENPSSFNTENKGGPTHPVENVSWNMIQTFLPKLQAMLPGCVATLSTEAEWEYACRAGTTTPFSFGETINTKQVNYAGDVYGSGKEGQYRDQTFGVKILPANAWGLYQMHGNVWEWCADKPRQYKNEPVTDPNLAVALAPVLGTSAARVLRGGGWDRSARFVRSAYRGHLEPGGRYGGTGFRFALRFQPQASGV
jgi:formylglycine-generating enzyme